MPAAEAAAKKKSPQRIKPVLNPADFRDRDGLGSKFTLKNQDPDVSYYWSTLGSYQEYLRGLGYQEIIGSDDPTYVRPKTGRVVEGEPILRDEMILMGIHKDDLALIIQHGAEGQTGQAWADKVDAMLGRGSSPGGKKYLDNDPSIELGGHEATPLTREN